MISKGMREEEDEGVESDIEHGEERVDCGWMKWSFFLFSSLSLISRICLVAIVVLSPVTIWVRSYVLEWTSKLFFSCSFYIPSFYVLLMEATIFVSVDSMMYISCHVSQNKLLLFYFISKFSFKSISLFFFWVFDIIIYLELKFKTFG